MFHVEQRPITPSIRKVSQPFLADFVRQECLTYYDSHIKTAFSFSETLARFA